MAKVKLLHCLNQHITLSRLDVIIVMIWKKSICTQLFINKLKKKFVRCRKQDSHYTSSRYLLIGLLMAVQLSWFHFLNSRSLKERCTSNIIIMHIGTYHSANALYAVLSLYRYLLCSSLSSRTLQAALTKLQHADLFLTILGSTCKSLTSRGACSKSKPMMEL